MRGRVYALTYAPSNAHHKPAINKHQLRDIQAAFEGGNGNPLAMHARVGAHATQRCRR